MIIGMARRHTLPQLKKYDVNQKVIESLADVESRSILFTIIKKGKTASELSEKLRIPLSSVYKKLAELDALALVMVEKYAITERGRRYKVYKSRISRAEIFIKKPEPVLSLIPN